MPRSIGIRVFKGDEQVDAYVFDRDIIKIGRLASAHLRLEDPKVSRIHAVIDITGANQEVSIIDMGSAEGTRVNGDKVSRVRLKHGDEVGLGDSRLVVVLGHTGEVLGAEIGDVEDSLPRSLAFRLSSALQLYRRSSFLDQLVDHRRLALCDTSANYHETQRNSLRGKEPTALPLEVL